ncbi:MAG: FG-GAP repeat domain-containing protein [Planctomycetota bacterium]|jgi:hypothetical protein
MRSVCRFLLLLLPVLALFIPLSAGWSQTLSDELEPPVRVLAAGKAVDVQRSGNAAPLLSDLDGDGHKDLLVGELHDGRLRIYRNRGTTAEPKFEGYTWFKAGADLGRVPSG